SSGPVVSAIQSSSLSLRWPRFLSDASPGVSSDVSPHLSPERVALARASRPSAPGGVIVSSIAPRADERAPRARPLAHPVCRRLPNAPSGLLDYSAGGAQPAAPACAMSLSNTKIGLMSTTPGESRELASTPQGVTP